MTSSLRTAIFATCLLGLASPSWAEAAPYEVDGVSIELPAPPTGSVRAGGRLFVSLGMSGVAIVDVEARPAVVLEIRSLGGQATGVISLDGAPWVIVEETRAVPMMAPGEVSPTGPGGDGSPTSLTAGGRVVAVSGGSAVIDRGSEAGLVPGQGVRFVARIPVEMEGMTAAEGEALYREEEVALGEIAIVGAGRSQVTLRRGGRTAEGQYVEILPADEWRGDERGARFAPRRLGDVSELVFTLRPFLAVGTLGVGSVNEISLSHAFEAPAFAEVRVQPLTLGWSREGNLVGTSVTALGGYDNPIFAIGLGVGITAANTGVTGIAERFTYTAEDSAGGGRGATFVNVNRGFTLGQVVRLGARDGLNLEVRNTFVLGTVEVYDYPGYTDEGEPIDEEPTLVETYSEFRWGSTNARVAVPVADLTDLFVEVGGGATGYFSASGGVHSWVRGNGDGGSLGLAAAAGYGLMAGEPEETNITLQGPLFSFSARWRF